MSDRMQVAADHIGAFHAYMNEISAQLTEIDSYVWEHVALTDAFGDGLLAPLKDHIRKYACLPFGDALSKGRTSMGLARYGLWDTGSEYDKVDGEVSEYFAETASFQDE
ncbi:hypothetical protein ACOACO_02305 [Nocardioides sp. CPCC 205120]|uniref:hypothetical protein n=1 Tax=Nocardioides sp. CPCC 205120 TaxID=3406462 RepID=UPI003B50D1D7